MLSGQGITLAGRWRDLLNDAQRLTNRAEKARQLDVALRGICEVRGCLQLVGQVSGELKTQLHVSGSLTLALRNVDDSQVKQTLLDAGHAGWYRVDPSKPARNEREIFELLARGLRSLDDQATAARQRQRRGVPGCGVSKW